MDDARRKQILKDFGTRLAACRAARGLSQADVAEQLGHTSPETVSRYERGEREPRYTSLLRLAEIFDIPMAALCVGIDGGPTRYATTEQLEQRASALVRELASRDRAAAEHAVAAMSGVLALLDGTTERPKA